MDVLNNEFLLFLKCAGKNHLQYMVIGGYAVNYYGYIRNTRDLDIWIAPTNENKKSFIDTLLCMKYSQEEVSALSDEDFTIPFVAHIGSEGSMIDILTVVHHSLSYDEAQKNMVKFEIENGVFMNLVPYDFLKSMKLFAKREKDFWDISKLEEIRNFKKNTN